MMIVATCSHHNAGRLIVWDIDTNQTRIIDRQIHRATSMVWTEDDKWLIIGRSNGELEFWNVYNENDYQNKNQIQPKLSLQYSQSTSNDQQTSQKTKNERSQRHR